jgi:transcriptional regulator with XRE-family HTH domain
VAEQVSDGHEGRLANTRQNRAAGRALRAARLSLGPQGSKQTAFAATLSRELGMPFTATALSGWENGKRSVPGAVLVAAAMITGQSLDALFGEAGEPDVVQWVETLGLPQRVLELEEELRQHGALLATAMNDLEAMKAGMERAGITPEGTEVDRSRTGTDQ